MLVYRIEQGRIKQVENFAADQHAADAFFWRVWGDELAPLRARMARVHELMTMRADARESTQGSTDARAPSGAEKEVRT